MFSDPTFNCAFQTRTLLSVFEEDANTLTDYSNQLLQSMQRVFGAQVNTHTHARTECAYTQRYFTDFILLDEISLRIILPLSN